MFNTLCAYMWSDAEGNETRTSDSTVCILTYRMEGPVAEPQVVRLVEKRKKFRK